MFAKKEMVPGCREKDAMKHAKVLHSLSWLNVKQTSQDGQQWLQNLLCLCVFLGENTQCGYK